MTVTPHCHNEVMDWDRSELAWAAGFFDGEGNTHARYGKTPIMTVPQAEPTTLERFHRAVCGLGYVNLRYGGKIPEGCNSRQWAWTLQNYGGVQQVMCLLWPFLSGPKKQQMRDVFESAHANRTAPLGQRHHNQKLTLEKVEDIQQRCEAGESASAIAEVHGVTMGTVYDIRAGRTWNYATGIERHDGKQLKPEQVREIDARLRAGEKQQDIARDYNVHQATISNINTGHRWSKVTGRKKNV